MCYLLSIIAFVKNTKVILILNLGIFMVILLLGNSIAVYAQVNVPNTFSSGTTISSTQVNDNFNALAQSMPGIKTSIGGGAITLSSAWQNIASITVTPPVDGLFFVLGSTTPMFNPTDITNSTSHVGLCITQTSGGGSPCNAAGGGAFLNSTNFGSLGLLGNGPSMMIPMTPFGIFPVAKNIAITFYLTASTQGSTGPVSIGGGSTLTVMFFPGGYLP
jgi:hypothetical protein